MITVFHNVFRVNKPYLPIAAGDLSVQSAWFLVLMFAVAGLLTVGVNFGPFITSLYCLGLFLGTIYSVPPFRLKRFAVIAFLIIATVCLFVDVLTCFLLLLTTHVLLFFFFFCLFVCVCVCGEVLHVLKYLQGRNVCGLVLQKMFGVLMAKFSEM